MVILGSRSSTNQSHLHSWKLDGSIPPAGRKWSKLRSSVGRRGIQEHMTVPQKEFDLSRAACNVLAPFSFFSFSGWFFGVCVSCVYPRLTGLSESGAPLRIDTDTLSAHTWYTHTHSRPLPHLSADRVFSSSVGSPSSQADGEHTE